MDQRKIRRSTNVFQSTMEHANALLLDVVAVEVLPNYTLRITFENGEIRRFHADYLLSRAPFTELRDVTKFSKAYVAYGTVCWPQHLDVAPETLYDLSLLESVK